MIILNYIVMSRVTWERGQRPRQRHCPKGYAAVQIARSRALHNHIVRNRALLSDFTRARTKHTQCDTGPSGVLGKSTSAGAFTACFRSSSPGPAHTRLTRIRACGPKTAGTARSRTAVTDAPARGLPSLGPRPPPPPRRPCYSLPESPPRSVGMFLLLLTQFSRGQIHPNHLCGL